MESFVSELEQEVRCSLCKDRFIEPKLLKCFHTYCKACIKRHAQLQPDGETNIFKCPECLAETSLPELNDVDDILSSPLHTRILKVLDFVESDKICSVSKSHSTACWYCFECTRSFCDECQMNHSLFTKDNHSVISLSNLKKEDLEFILAKEDNCDRHGGWKLDFFCQDCDILICFECLRLGHGDHGDHKTILNEKHATTVKESLDDQLKMLNIQEDQMSSAVNVLEDFAVKGEKAIKEIQAKAKEIIEKVQQSELELIKEIQEQIDNSRKEKKKGWDVLSKTRRAKCFVTQVVEKHLPASQMKNVKALVRPVNDVVVPSIPEDSRIVFVPSQECITKVGLGKLIRENDDSRRIVQCRSNEHDKAKIEDNFTLIHGIICEKEDRFCSDEPEGAQGCCNTTYPKLGTNEEINDKKKSKNVGRMQKERERKKLKKKREKERIRKTNNKTETRQGERTSVEFSVQRPAQPPDQWHQWLGRDWY